MGKKPPVVQGKNFSVVHAGEWENLDQYNEYAKLFLKKLLQLTGMEISLNKVPPGQEAPFSHKHQKNEEVYLFVKGRGQFQVDGETFDVREGTVVRISPAGVRTYRNNSDEDLYYIAIQAEENSLTQWTFSDGIKMEEKASWPET